MRGLIKTNELCDVGPKMFETIPKLHRWRWYRVRSKLGLARRALLLQRAWIRVAREAVGADGRVVPQQWLAATTAPGVSSHDRHRLDLVIHDVLEAQVDGLYPNLALDLPPPVITHKVGKA